MAARVNLRRKWASEELMADSRDLRWQGANSSGFNVPGPVYFTTVIFCPQQKTSPGRHRPQLDMMHLRLVRPRGSARLCQIATDTMRFTQRSTPDGEHRPVLLDEVLALLAPLPGAVVIDCTVGWAGHSVELLRRIG